MSAPTTYQMEHELVALRHDLHQARAERGAAERQAAASYARAEELREAARALVDAMAQHVPGCGLCAAEGKSAPVMVRQGPYFACDEHAVELDSPKDFPYAPALRTLRALLGGAS